MKRNNKYPDTSLEEIAEEIRNEKIDPSAVANAADRVWSRIAGEQPSASVDASQAERIRGCEDFQSLIPAYLTGSLSEARALLFEDHTHECIPCRKALKEARGGASSRRPQPAAARASRSLSAPVKWGIAATLIIGLGILGLYSSGRLYNTNKAFRAIVSTMTGPAYVIADTGNRPVKVGEEIKPGERIRTSKDAGAVVTLPDGSQIEMKERSEFSVSENAEGITIRLERGNVIVQAAKQRSRHLYVSTNDCLVSVTGTIFSVNNGTKGSRVSVVEGEVHVDHSGEKHVLHPGQQVTTSENVEAVPVQDEIAWSRDSERYQKLLAEFAGLRKELNERVSVPEARYSTNLLDKVPEGTVLYVAIPNLSETIRQSHEIIEERVRENEALRQWWENERSSSNGRPGLDHIMDKIAEFGQYLGPEIVIAAGMDERGEPDAPVVLADLNDPIGFRAYLDQQLEMLSVESKKGSPVRVVDDPAMVAQSGREKSQEDVLVWIHDNFLAATPSGKSLNMMASSVKKQSVGRFAQSSFHSRIAELYEDGAGLIIAADLEKIIAQSIKGDAKSADRAKDSEAFRRLGLYNLKHFIVEVKEKDGKSQNRAVLSFDESQTGIPAWLAEPGPMGALDFISPDANLVAAFVVEQPVVLVDDLMATLESIDPNARQALAGFEQESGINIRNDFAATLGGEFAFAVDGPLLPTPSWKVVFEVNDSVHLQQTFERAVDRINMYVRMMGKEGLQWESAEIGGRTFYTLKSADAGMEFSYAYANGYLIAAPSRALVDRAIKYRESGYTITHSPRFTAALPEDKQVNFSALVYQNLTQVLAPLAGQVGKAGKLSQEEQLALRSAASATPVLAYAYAHGDRIIVSLNGEDGPLSLKPGSLLGVTGPFGLRQLLK